MAKDAPKGPKALPEFPDSMLRGGFLSRGAPDNEIPADGMNPQDARLLIEEELLLDSDPSATWRRS